MKSNKSKSKEIIKEKSNIKKVIKKKEKKSHSQFSKISSNNLNESGKPNWTVIKKKTLELKKLRKSKKVENYDSLYKAKQIWEDLRIKQLNKEKRLSLINQILDLFKDNMTKVILSHDGARIIQTMLKYGSEDQLNVIFEKLKTSIISITQSPYAIRIIVKFFKYGSKQLKHRLITSFYGHVFKLLSNSISWKLIEVAYLTANKEEKISLTQELYGDLYKLQKDTSLTCLEDVFASSPNMKSGILSTTKTNIIKLLNKSRHESLLLHSLINDFLKICNEEDRDEILALVRPCIEKYCTNKNGVFIAMLSIWHGSKKDRKHLMKNLKGSYSSLAQSNEGRFLLQAFFDCVDDTVALNKIIIPELVQSLDELIKNECGRRVLLYIVAHRNPTFFHPEEIKLLQKGDDNKFSKKPMEQRINEIRDHLNTCLIKAVSTDTLAWIRKTNIALLTLQVLLTSKGEDLKIALENLVKIILDKSLTIKIQKKNITCPYLEHPGIYKILKKLIVMDFIRDEEEKLVKISFGEMILREITPSIIEWLLSFNRGCFFLLTLFELDPISFTKNVKLTNEQILKTSVDSSNMKGLKLLKIKLKAEK